MMRAIHIANEKQRDAEVAFHMQAQKSRVHTILPDGTEKINVKLLKATAAIDEEELVAGYEDLTTLAQVLIEDDPEIDMEVIGKKLFRTHKLYVDKDNKIAYRINLFQVIRNPDGTEKERRDLNRVPSNVNAAVPLKWTGKKYPKADAVRRFVFTRKYQIRHINGVTFDFLYNMAKELQESNTLMLVGGGPKGNQPILLTRGGEPYRGFLEGRVEGERYCLILHLTNIEMKGIKDGTISE